MQRSQAQAEAGAEAGAVDAAALGDSLTVGNLEPCRSLCLALPSLFASCTAGNVCLRCAEPEPEGPFKGKPRKLHNNDPSGTREGGGGHQYLAEGVFAEDPIAPRPVGLEAYWQGVQRLEGRYAAAAICEAAQRAEQEHAARLAAAATGDGALAKRAEQAQGAGQRNAVDGGSGGATEPAASRTGAARAAEADVIELSDSDGEGPAQAAKRPRLAPPKPVPRAQANLAARTAPAQAQAAAAAGAKTAYGMCELSSLARACHRGAAPLEAAAAGASNAAANDASWMFGGDASLHRLLCAAHQHMGVPVSHILVWMCDYVLNLDPLLKSFLCIRGQSLDACGLQHLLVFIFGHNTLFVNAIHPAMNS